MDNNARYEIDKDGAAFSQEVYCTKRKPTEIATLHQNNGDTSSSRSRSTDAGNVLAVRDQDGADYDDEMRRTYVVFYYPPIWHLSPLSSATDNKYSILSCEGGSTPFKAYFLSKPVYLSCPKR